MLWHPRQRQLSSVPTLCHARHHQAQNCPELRGRAGLYSEPSSSEVETEMLTAGVGFPLRLGPCGEFVRGPCHGWGRSD